MWIRHERKNHRVICGISLESDCGVIYDLTSQILKCPPHQFYLSNGVKILVPGHPLKCYATSKNVVHGLHLDCVVKCVGGDGSDDEGESFEGLLTVHLSVFHLSLQDNFHMGC